ncbi:DUF2142 domain-containing protein [Enterococcus faecalis]|nr:DUF2142 domain-containing protein [Enterococcus faecalis]
MESKVGITKLVNLAQQGNNIYKVKDSSKPGKIFVKLPKSGFNKLSFYSSEILSENKSALSGKIGVATKYTDYGDSKILGRYRVINLKDGLQELTITIKNNDRNKIILSDISVRSTFHFNLIRFIVITCCIGISFMAIFNFFYKKYHIFLFTLIIFFGVMLSFLMPVGTTMDEQAHLIKSISVANGDFFFKNHDSLFYAQGMNKMYAETVQNLPLSYEDFREFYNVYSSPENKTLISQPSSTSASTYPFIPYIFSGLGVKIAMMFHLPPFFYVWLARAFNVLAYAILGYLTIKKVPYGKRLLLFFIAQPVLIYLSASIGVDALLIGTILLGFSNILSLRYNKSIVTWRDLLIISLCFSLSIIIKPVYAPILLVFFLLRRENFYSAKHQWISYMILSAVLFFVSILVYLYSDKMGLNQWHRSDTDTTSQILNIVHNPVIYIKMLIQYFSNNAIEFSVAAFSLMGYVLTLNEFITILNVGLLLFLCIADVSNDENKKRYLSFLDKLLIGLSTLSMLILSATALYITFTPVGFPKIEGYQARYLLPMVALLLFIPGTKRIKITYSDNKLDVISMMSILSLLAFITLCILSIYYK